MIPRRTTPRLFWSGFFIDNREERNQIMSGEKSLLVNLFKDGKYCSVIVRNRKIKPDGRSKYAQTKLSVVFDEETEGLRRISGTEEGQSVRVPAGPMQVKIGAVCTQLFPFCKDMEEDPPKAVICGICGARMGPEICPNCGASADKDPTVPCSFGCNNGRDVAGDPCEQCGGTGYEMARPARKAKQS